MGSNPILVGSFFSLETGIPFIFLLNTLHMEDCKLAFNSETIHYDGASPLQIAITPTEDEKKAILVTIIQAYFPHQHLTSDQVNHLLSTNASNKELTSFISYMTYEKGFSLELSNEPPQTIIQFTPLKDKEHAPMEEVSSLPLPSLSFLFSLDPSSNHISNP